MKKLTRKTSVAHINKYFRSQCMVWLSRSADLAQALFLSAGLTHASAVTGGGLSLLHMISHLLAAQRGLIFMVGRQGAQRKRKAFTQHWHAITFPKPY